MNIIKKALAWVGLAAMAVFIIATVVLFVSGKLAENLVWIYAPLSVFLIAGLGALLIRYLQERAERARQEQQK